MNTPPCFRFFFRAGCQHRAYAIMSRAKAKAGLLEQKLPTLSKQVKPKPVKQAHNELMPFRKPAGLKERLVKVNTSIVQPENPHLLKVAVIGAANAGKSTLVNRLVGEQISGVSPKAHTTRERILAVLTEANQQIVFLDTPGIIPDRNHAKMNRTLATSSWRSLDEADHLLIVVDASRAIQPQAQSAEEFLLDQLVKQQNNKEPLPATLILNKMDLMYKENGQLDHVVQRYLKGYHSIQKTLYTSAVYEEGLCSLKELLFSYSQPAQWLFPADQKTEMPDLKRVEEMIRIEFFKRLHQYIPYMLRQENAGWTELSDGTLRIDQNVYVERDSQQKIVIGQNGRIINKVVEEARKHISHAFNRPVQLFIQVKTRRR
ncbi:GTPase Era [Choanephora cucurbitarum]|uniref:GTPase Era n=1 Tax=Choanephora cucurbitarum TaxID=101091 RepID=A0A1C7MXS3_9FUNG|nr:GTPase Era [Choanephora cucurbitarum]